MRGNLLFLSRLCALGYCQLPGIYRTENFIWVFNEVKFCILMGMMMRNGWEADIEDIVIASLYCEVPEEIYMKILQGIEESSLERYEENDRLVPKKEMYGLVQAAR